MTPHSVLAHRYAQPGERPSYVKQLFDLGAEHYDPVVCWGFFGAGNLSRKYAQASHGIKPGMNLLDLACGTGLMPVAASQVFGSDKTITCVEASDGMLAMALKKPRGATFIQRGAEKMPIAEGSQDCLGVGCSLRHFADLLAPVVSCTVCSSSMSPVLPARSASDSSSSTSASSIPSSLVSSPAEKAEEMMVYFWETMDTCVRPEAVVSALNAAGFHDARRIATVGVFSEYVAVKA